MAQDATTESRAEDLTVVFDALTEDGETRAAAAATDQETSAAAEVSSGRHRRARPTVWERARSNRTLVIATAATIVAIAGTAVLMPMAFARLKGGPDRPSAPIRSGEPSTPGPSPSARPPGLVARTIDIDVDGKLAWVLLDRQTGKLSGSDNRTDRVAIGPMARAWVVADYLRRTAEAGEQPSQARLALASRAIRDGDDDATQVLHASAGGVDQSRRLITTCGLAESAVQDGGWRRTQVSATDAVRLGACIADGRAAGPEWTEWLLAEMSQVYASTADKGELTGVGWGIIDGVPAELDRDDVAISNGSTLVGSRRQVNCLAATDDWVLAVLVNYPAARGISYGAGICADVTAGLAPPGTA